MKRFITRNIELIAIIGTVAMLVTIAGLEIAGISTTTSLIK